MERLIKEILKLWGMQLQDNRCCIGNLQLGYPIPNNGEYLLVVHPLTSPSHRRKTEPSLEYISALKTYVDLERSSGKNIVWMLDSGTDSSGTMRALARGRTYSGLIEKYDKRVTRMLEGHVGDIAKSLGINANDTFLVTEAKNPLSIFSGLLSRKELELALSQLSPRKVQIAGEIYNSNHGYDADARGCVNNVIGACLRAGIPIDRGPVLHVSHSF